MRRFFLEEIGPDTETARITGAEFTHLKKVLRLSTGASIELFNGRGVEAEAVIEEMGGDFADVRVTKVSQNRRESPVEITLLQAFVKGDKPEFIIQKATELGASEIAFYTTERTVPLAPNPKRQARWRKVAIGAAKQCRRSVLPRITIAGTLEKVLSEWKGRDGLKLALWEETDAAGSIKEALRSGGKTGGVVVLVGPEGGFTKDEVGSATEAGFIPVGLGPRILRAETAAVSVLTLLQYELGDLN